MRKLGGQSRRRQGEERRGKETALASLLTLTPHYFPAELYSSKDQRRALSAFCIFLMRDVTRRRSDGFR